MKTGATDQLSESVGSYEDIALEYYDHRRHPTCRDFRELSMKFLVPYLRAGLPQAGSLVEMGAGSSILAPEAAAVGALSRVILVDSSPRMLSYSSRWIACGACSLIASAVETGLPAGTVSLIVSSLGDPYNGPGFWEEVARLLSPGGTCLFTTPSFEWSSSFRSVGDRDVAEFLRADGVRLFVPSHVSNEEEQVGMIAAAGLFIQDRRDFVIEVLDKEPAPKLLCVGPSTSVLSAYAVRAPR